MIAKAVQNLAECAEDVSLYVLYRIKRSEGLLMEDALNFVGNAAARSRSCVVRAIKSAELLDRSIRASGGRSPFAALSVVVGELPRGSDRPSEPGKGKKLDMAA